jgi:hypothetical protein
MIIAYRHLFFNYKKYLTSMLKYACFTTIILVEMETLIKRKQNGQPKPNG